MFGNQAFERLRQMFSDQFEPDGKHYLYRKYMKGAPIQVTAGEREKYIELFDNFLRYGSWGIIGGTIVWGMSLAFYAVETGTNLSEAAVYIGFGSITAAFMAGYYWTWNLPARELRGRGTVGDARSRSEIRRLFLSRLTYGQIAGGAGAGALLIFRAVSKGALLSGWQLAEAIMGAVIIILAAVQALRKWRFESKDK